MTRLQRSFPTREELARSFLRRLTETGMEVELPGHGALPAGTSIDLDLRLQDGSPLLVGRGEVVPAPGVEDGFRRIRFVELDAASRAELPGLVALSQGPAAATPEDGAPDPDDTLAGLVAGVFGEPRPQAVPDPDDTILVPPEPPSPAAKTTTRQTSVDAERAGPASTAGLSEPPHEAPAPAGGRPEKAPPRRSFLRRLQVSPAVIVASIIAGATGAAADAWFEDIAAFLGQLTGAETENLTAPPRVDLLPVGVAPSEFPEEESAPAAPAEPEPAAMSPGPPGAAPGPTDAPGAGLPADPHVIPAVAEDSAPLEDYATPANRVRVITWDASADGTTVTFWGNGAFLPRRVERIRVAGGNPRELVKLHGIDLPFPESVLEPETPEVVRIRTGFHPQRRVNELHVVLDLAGPDVEVDRVDTGPASLRIHLRRTADPPAPSAE